MIVAFLILLFGIVSNYYLTGAAYLDWFKNDDFYFLVRYSVNLLPELQPQNSGLLSLLGDTFFRPVTRNLFWWLADEVCQMDYPCYLRIHVGLIILGSLMLPGSIAIALRITPRQTKKKYALTPDGALDALAITLPLSTALLMSDITMDLASWVSNTQASFTFLAFSTYLFIVLMAAGSGILASRTFLMPSLVVEGMIALSNMGYYLATSWSSISAMIMWGHSRRGMVGMLIKRIAFFTCLLLLYKHTVVSKIQPGMPYSTSIDIDTFLINLSFYYKTDGLSFFLYGTEVLSSFVLAILSRSAIKTEPHDAYERKIVTDRVKIQMLLNVLSAISLTPFLFQTIQRYPYYLFLFRSVVWVNLLPTCLILGRCLVGTGNSTPKARDERMRLYLVSIMISVLGMVSAERNPEFVRMSRERGEGASLQFMKALYRLDPRPKDLCLVPSDDQRRPKDDPFYPDEFWWLAGHGNASSVYARQHNLSEISLSYASFSSDCQADVIGTVKKTGQNQWRIDMKRHETQGPDLKNH